MHQRTKTQSGMPVRGFALVTVLACLVLLTILVVALLNLSTIALRGSNQTLYAGQAKANARLAMILALSDLQRQAGPDTRATAAASILAAEGISQPHWTGVWSTRGTDGGPLLTRDDKSGGLRDTRNSGADQEKLALGWLVSGGQTGSRHSPRQPPTGESVKLVGPGSVGTAAAADEVSAPRVTISTGSTPASGKTTDQASGHYAWWVGDLGIKANIATPDAFEGKSPDPSSPGTGGWYRLLTSQEADASAVAADGLDASKKRRLATDSTPKLFNLQPTASADKHFHDFTTHSDGLLVDMANGGLKRDLTAYFLSNGTIADHLGLPGLSDQDNLVGPANSQDPIAARDGVSWADTRHQFTSPKFGLLRRWATIAAPFGNRTFGPVPPKPEPHPRTAASQALALANENPTSLAAADTPNISPILVEGSLFFNMSWHHTVQRAGQPPPSQPFQTRLHIYPRFVLWNPYNVELTLDRCLGMIQGNGRQEMKTNNYSPATPASIFTVEWIWTEGGRNNNFSGSILTSSGYTDPYNGCWYFSIPRTTFAPGECLVFSPDKGAEYNRLNMPGNTSGNYALEANSLTCLMPPHPSRSYYTSDSEIDGGIGFIPTEYWFTPISWLGGITNQADDCRVVLKQLGSTSNVKFEDFDQLPQLALLSASLQFGGGREPRIAWSGNEKIPVEETSADTTAVLIAPPNVRTREGIRLRWFEETQSNLENSGSLKGTPHFDDALLANWNPRAAYSTRSPYENIAGSMPTTGSLGGPWFFGAYTRDLYDGAVSWNDQMPVARNGRYHGYPFGPPQEGAGKPVVLFDLPREGTGVLSIGQFQHAKLSEFIWHPSYTIGQSLADPRLANASLSGLDRSAPIFTSAAETQQGGFDTPDIGWSSDVERSANRDAWSTQARAIYQDFPVTDNLVYDQSFELNQTLWDSFFLSTGSSNAKHSLLSDPAHPPLPNGRMHLAPVTGTFATSEDLADFHRCAYGLSVDGAFNVNSTSVDAWKAVLGATRRLSPDGKSAVFSRILSPPDGPWTATDSADAQAAWSGKRSLNDDEIDRLARAIVTEVRKRGPFLSLADFVNRRLANNSSGRMGALQAAIEAAELNARFKAAYPLDNSRSLPDYQHPDNIRDATRLEQTLKPDSKVWGIPGYLTQGDLLQVLGPMLNARSDTFIIRAYGDAADASGKIQARAWCEAVVQRCPEPLAPDASAINSDKAGKPTDMGRRFVLKSFRWLCPEEV
ncbi:MAG: hypothetical protein WCP35_05230 [Verrucomicrobiota bacterium]